MRADGSSDFLRSDDLWHDALPTLTGHKDSEATICPGNSLYSYVNRTLRKNAVVRLAPFATPAVVLSGPTSREATAPASLSFSWSGAARYEYRLEGWRKTNPDDIEYWTPGGWSTSEPTSWTPTAGSSVSFTNLERGHYTLHLRGYDSAGKLSAVEANRTVLVR